ncbi:MAG: DNA topoisomerase IV subunit A, partial [Clostridium sp.]|nr:DNA topoisomerase IV subunit A [Clostridium sp.]
VNGSFGIAVGLATNIPPHNLGEVTDAVLACIDNPEITTEQLMEYIKAPDLPTGGILIGKKSLLSAYETGEGKVTLRAKTSIETLENGRLGIVITEFPYRRCKAKLLQTISEMTGDKKHQKVLESIVDIRDESDRSGIRAVIEFKKAATRESVDKVLKYLFKKTDLQCNLSFNMVALANGKPQTMGLKTILMHYVNHQKEIITRRTIKELAIAEKRFHIVEGFIKAINILDEVIETIRSSKSKKDAGINLVTKFSFTNEQAEAILELMLYRLTGLEITVFQKEYAELQKKIKKLKKILDNEKELLKVIKSELKEITDKYRNPRRTMVVENDSEAKIDVEELIVVEDVMITLSKDGFIKRLPVRSYTRSNSNADDIDYRDGDELKYLFKSNTADNVILFTDKGNMYQTKGINIPEGKWKEKGERIDSIIKTLNLEEENIISAMSINIFDAERSIQLITNKGTIKKSSLDKFVTNYSKLQALKLRENEIVVSSVLVDSEFEGQFLEVKSKLGLEFKLQLPELQDMQRNILGQQLFNLTADDEVVEVTYTNEFEYCEFSVGLTAKNSFKAFAKAKKNDRLKVSTDNLSDVILFSNKGNIYKVKGFLLTKINEKDIPLTNLVDGFTKGERILDIYSVKDFNSEKMLYFFTKKGMVKKTSLIEYAGEYLVQQAYKLKYENDEVIAVQIAHNILNDVIIITKHGMAIKFSSENVNSMGRVASGVTGISLKDGDEAIAAKVKENHEDLGVINNDVITLISKKKEKKDINEIDIKLQNRAGRGSIVMVTGLDDEVTETIFQ